MKPNDAFQGITTLLTTIYDTGTTQGTGFFYQEFAQPEPDKPPEWRMVQRLWLVTNRHLMFPKVGDKEFIPTSITFHLRKIDGQTLSWEPITITREDFLKRAKVHPATQIDICIVDVLDLILSKLKAGGEYIQWHGVTRDNFVGKNNIFAEAGDDVLVIGYPRSFYDHVNLYPIVKSGIIASKWEAYFNGLPQFLIDGKLFPGSSGSIVVTKPRDLVVVDGSPMFSKEKQFAFLGIYSGEPIIHQKPIELDDLIITQKSGFNLGIAWYGTLVQDVVDNGVVYSQEASS